MYSAPSAEFKFSAAIDGSLIQSCKRFTASSWRFVTSCLIAPRSSAALTENAVASATMRIKARRIFVLIEIPLTKVTKDHNENLWFPVVILRALCVRSFRTQRCQEYGRKE